jgi:hypothetical protein
MLRLDIKPEIILSKIFSIWRTFEEIQEEMYAVPYL